MILFKRNFHNYFANNFIKDLFKKSEHISFNDIQKKIYIGKSSLGGLGVFTLEDIKKNEIIEICPTVSICNEEIPRNLVDYLYEGKEPSKNKAIVDIIINRKKETSNYKLLPLGYGILYNHSDIPNAFVEIHKINKNQIKQKQDATVSNNVIIVYAYNNIQKDDEILISYGHSWWKVSS
ncbi:SET domain protein, putative [Plasmodium reichenowi]|uniref:SET domain protein, putative n=1 Tax=Plasmodium reichenowi TaxID=5854 RepID=A0A151L8G2_PLARE|nr:SET domain protein, putative [Plasmodium reichenowi]KYN95253.1 SET domain protein, putative [Plasmodium reichenowi]SOV80584.1 SET domain protein, putative [Plasmodium reichenowi]